LMNCRRVGLGMQGSPRLERSAWSFGYLGLKQSLTRELAFAVRPALLHRPRSPTSAIRALRSVSGCRSVDRCPWRGRREGGRFRTASLASSNGPYSGPIEPFAGPDGNIPPAPLTGKASKPAGCRSTQGVVARQRIRLRLPADGLVDPCDGSLRSPHGRRCGGRRHHRVDQQGWRAGP